MATAPPPAPPAPGQPEDELDVFAAIGHWACQAPSQGSGGSAQERWPDKRRACTCAGPSTESGCWGTSPPIAPPLPPSRSKRGRGRGAGDTGPCRACPIPPAPPELAPAPPKASDMAASASNSCGGSSAPADRVGVGDCDAGERPVCPAKRVTFAPAPVSCHDGDRRTGRRGSAAPASAPAGLAQTASPPAAAPPSNDRVSSHVTPHAGPGPNGLGHSPSAQTSDRLATELERTTWACERPRPDPQARSSSFLSSSAVALTGMAAVSRPAHSSWKLPPTSLPSVSVRASTPAPMPVRPRPEASSCGWFPTARTKVTFQRYPPRDVRPEERVTRTSPASGKAASTLSRSSSGSAPARMGCVTRPLNESTKKPRSVWPERTNVSICCTSSTSAALACTVARRTRLEPLPGPCSLAPTPPSSETFRAPGKPPSVPG
mmetsp:Transcript_16649/g.63078  ORF Transcript_16649/g.63078 Transcript_16649/m.63078 type:complete len:433 (+) Transcript_16649:104-1402(+)